MGTFKKAALGCAVAAFAIIGGVGCGAPQNGSGEAESLARTGTSPIARTAEPGGQPPPTTGPEATVTEIPASLRLPGEGERGWLADDALDTLWALGPCQPAEYPTDRTRTDMRTIRNEGVPEYSQVRQLVVYRTTADAHEALAEFRQALATCKRIPTTTDGAPATQLWRVTSTPVGSEPGILAYSAVYRPDGDQVTAAGDEAHAIIRRANAVFLVAVSGEVGDQRPALQQVAADYVNTLCVFEEACD